VTRYPLYMKAGDDETRVFKYLDFQGVTIVLTGFTASWIGTVGSTTVTVTGTVDGPNGRVTVVVPHANTTSLQAAGDIGYYKLKVTSGGGAVTTIAGGPLIMTSPKD